MHAQSPIATAPSAITDERITELHLWAVREGLRRAPAATPRGRGHERPVFRMPANDPVPIAVMGCGILFAAFDAPRSPRPTILNGGQPTHAG
jgi:hypothetical protein